MATARALILPPGVAGNFHVISRCVRRSWLCGIDPYNQRNYEHRRAWVEQRIHALADIFAVGIHSFAVMSNHVHLVIRVEPDLTTSWTDHEVAERGDALHCPAKFSEMARQNRIDAWQMNPKRLAELRLKLGSLSYFMQALNQPIAIAANKEDGCTGKFWERLSYSVCPSLMQMAEEIRSWKPKKGRSDRISRGQRGGNDAVFRIPSVPTSAWRLTGARWKSF